MADNKADKVRAAREASKLEWSNEPGQVIEETPRELRMAKLADAAKDIQPRIYDITSKNTKAIRVVHDASGRAVTIPPGETKRGIKLLPLIAGYLDGGDLTLTASA